MGKFIEILMVLAFVGVIVALAVSANGVASGQSTLSFGLNGVTEMRCINGMQFVIGEGGQARQVLDEFGKGLRCEKS